MSATDLRKALESDETFLSWGNEEQFDTDEEAAKWLRANILALIDEERRRAVKDFIADTGVTPPVKVDRLDAYVQAALTGYLAGNLDSGDAVLHGPEAVVFIAKEIMAEVDKSIGETK